MAPFVILGPAEGQPNPAFVAPCATVRDHNQFVRHVLRYSNRGGDYHASTVTTGQLAQLGSMRSCMKRIDRAKYRLERGAWSKRRAVWAFHRHIDQITPYGKYAVPVYIVMRESGGDRCAKNPTSTAGGYYQMLDSSFAAGGGRGAWAPGHPAACAPDWMQHQAAANLWRGGAGASHWALTA